MYLIAGLGNIGEKYKLTRHNFGFLLVDEIVRQYNVSHLSSKKFDSESFLGLVDSKQVLILKPSTMMNLSGKAILAAKSFYKIDTQNIIVLHDEIDLGLGKIRVREGEGNFSHNGLRSIDQMIGGGYTKIRLGVGRPQLPNQSVADYVLQNFDSSEMDLVKSVVKKISDLIPMILNKSYNEFLNRFNN